MEKKFFASKKGNVFRRKSDGVVIGRFVFDTAIDGYEEVVDERPMSERRGFRGRMNPHRPSLQKKQ